MKLNNSRVALNCWPIIHHNSHQTCWRAPINFAVSSPLSTLLLDSISSDLRTIISEYDKNIYMYIGDFQNCFVELVKSVPLRRMTFCVTRAKIGINGINNIANMYISWPTHKIKTNEWNSNLESQNCHTCHSIEPFKCRTLIGGW